MIRPSPGKIVLIFPPHWNTPVPPLGISYLGSFLGSKGYDVSLHDLNREFWGESDLSDQRLHPVLDQIISERPSVVGLSLGVTNFWNGLRIARYLKNCLPNLLIVVGGPHISYIGEKIVQDFADCIDLGVYSEGEEALLEIVQNFPDGNLSNIRGTVVRVGSEGRARRNPLRRPHIASGDLPFPSFDNFKLDRYPLPMLPIATTRGCNRSCTFCGLRGSNVVGAFRERTVESVVAEMARNVEAHKCNFFLMGDTLVNPSRKRLEWLCNAILHEGLKVYWMACAYPDLDRAMCHRMYAAGCRGLWISPETGSPSTAQMMNKGVNLEIARESIVNAKEAGIFTSVWFILGFPTENKYDVELTIDYARHLKDYMDECVFVPFTLFKGSPVYVDPGRFGIRDVQEGPFYAMSAGYTRRDESFDQLYILEQVQLLWDEFNRERRFIFEAELEGSVTALAITCIFDKTGSEEKWYGRLAQVATLHDGSKAAYDYVDLFRHAFREELRGHSWPGT